MRVIYNCFLWRTFYIKKRDKKIRMILKKADIKLKKSNICYINIIKLLPIFFSFLPTRYINYEATKPCGRGGVG